MRRPNAMNDWGLCRMMHSWNFSRDMYMVAVIEQRLGGNTVREEDFNTKIKDLENGRDNITSVPPRLLQ